MLATCPKCGTTGHSSKERGKVRRDMPKRDGGFIRWRRYECRNADCKQQTFIGKEHHNPPDNTS